MNKKLITLLTGLGYCLSQSLFASTPLVIGIDIPYIAASLDKIQLKDCKKHVYFTEQKCRQLGRENMAQYLSKALNTDVEIRAFNKIKALETAMIQGKVDFALLHPGTYQNLSERNPQKLTPLLTVMERIDETNPLADYYYSDLMVKKDSKIKGITELKNKTLGMQCHSLSSQIVPWILLKRNHIEPSQDIHIKYYQSPAALVDALNANQVDAIFVWNYQFEHQILGQKIKKEDFNKLMSYKIPNLIFVASNKTTDQEKQKKFSQAMQSLPEDAYIGMSFQGVKPYQEKNYQNIFQLSSDYHKLPLEAKGCASNH